jgi:integrin beta 3
MLDEKRLASSLVAGAKGYIDKALTGLLARIDALEKRQPERGEPGPQGERGERGLDGQPGADGVGVADALLGHDGALVLTLSSGETKSLGIVVGKDGAPGAPGKDGADGAVGPEGPPGPQGEPGTDGKDVDPEVVKALVEEACKALLPELVTKAVDSIPRPKDGADGKDGAPGADGIGLASGDGNLVITTTDGKALDLGAVVGRDGVDGAKGVDGQNGQPGEPGRDGAPGKDGQDGVGFDDLTAEYDGERTITLKFVRGDRVKSFAFDVPVVLDRGVYREGSEYKAGDAVTWAGSVWIAQRDTKAKPDAGDDWRLSVKRGRDGRSAPVERGPATNVPVGAT